MSGHVAELAKAGAGENAAVIRTAAALMGMPVAEVQALARIGNADLE